MKRVIHISRGDTGGWKTWCGRTRTKVFVEGTKTQGLPICQKCHDSLDRAQMKLIGPYVFAANWVTK